MLQLSGLGKGTRPEGWESGIENCGSDMDFGGWNVNIAGSLQDNIRQLVSPD